MSSLSPSRRRRSGSGSGSSGAPGTSHKKPGGPRPAGAAMSANTSVVSMPGMGMGTQWTAPPTAASGPGGASVPSTSVAGMGMGGAEEQLAWSARTFQIERRTLLENINSLQARIRHLELETDRLRRKGTETSSKQRAEAEKQKKRAAEAQEQKTQAEEARRQAEHLLEAAIEKTEAQAREIRALNSKLHSRQQETKSAVAMERSERAELLRDVERQRRSQNDTIDSLRRELHEREAAWEGERRTYATAVEEAMSKVKSAQDRMSDNDDRIQTLEARVEDYEQQLRDLSAELQEEREQHREVRLSLTNTKEVGSRAQRLSEQREQEYLSKIEVVERQRDEADKKATRVESEMRRMREHLMSQISEFTLQLDQRSTELSRVREDLASLRERNAKVEEENQALHEMTHENDALLQEAGKRISSLTQKLATDGKQRQEDSSGFLAELTLVRRQLRNKEKQWKEAMKTTQHRLEALMSERHDLVTQAERAEHARQAAVTERNTVCDEVLKQVEGMHVRTNRLAEDNERLQLELRDAHNALNVAGLPIPPPPGQRQMLGGSQPLPTPLSAGGEPGSTAAAAGGRPASAPSMQESFDAQRSPYVTAGASSRTTLHISSEVQQQQMLQQQFSRSGLKSHDGAHRTPVQHSQHSDIASEAFGAADESVPSAVPGGDGGSASAAREISVTAEEYNEVSAKVMANILKRESRPLDTPGSQAGRAYR